MQYVLQNTLVFGSQEISEISVSHSVCIANLKKISSKTF